MADHLAALIEAVETADSSASLFMAVRNLAGAGLEGAIPTLIAALSYNNPGAAIASVSGLVQLGDAAVPAILEQLDAHNYTARAWAIRALAEIGDPRGLIILLEAATSDFAVSVRRAATKGLGGIRWHGFPPALLASAQNAALSALLNIAQQDDEWVVRYAAVAGLQQFANDLKDDPGMQSQIEAQLQQMTCHERSLTVRARAQMAQQHLQSERLQPETAADPPSSLTETDWDVIRDRLSALGYCTETVTPNAIA